MPAPNPRATALDAPAPPAPRAAPLSPPCVPPRAPRRIALFDLDHTLLPLDSDHAWGAFTCTLGWVDGAAFSARNDAFFADYQAGRLDIHAYARFATDAVRQRGPQQAALAHQRFMREVIGPAITPQALALLRSHQQAGDAVAIVTATNEFVTGPIADALGVAELLAVQLARDAQGWITGEIAGVPTFRQGKVTRVQQWLAAQALARPAVHITFYSDSPNDLPLLEWADTPVATNPGPALRALAQQRGWRILDLFEPPPQ